MGALQASVCGLPLTGWGRPLGCLRSPATPGLGASSPPGPCPALSPMSQLELVSARGDLEAPIQCQDSSDPLASLRGGLPVPWAPQPLSMPTAPVEWAGRGCIERGEGARPSEPPRRVSESRPQSPGLSKSLSMPPCFRKSRKTQLSDMSATEGDGRWAGRKRRGQVSGPSPGALSHLSEH